MRYGFKQMTWFRVWPGVLASSGQKRVKDVAQTVSSLYRPANPVVGLGGGTVCADAAPT